MKLSEVFNQLAYGELSQLSLVDAATGLISTTKYGALVSHVNLALTALYKRFPLKEGTVSIGLVTGRHLYPLTTDGDIVFTMEPDEEDDFNDDILKVERVYAVTPDSDGDGEAELTELGLNDASDPLSCFTPKATVLKVPARIVAQSTDLPTELQTSTLKLIYRANHPILEMSASFNPERVTIELPYSHLEPLLLFVASRVNAPMGTGQFEGLAGNNFSVKYERACQLLEVSNLNVDQGSQNTRLQDNGWV